MSLRVILIALLVGLGVHHVAPLMPGHAVHAAHEAACVGCGEIHDMGGMLAATMLCVGMLAIAAALPRLRRRLSLLASRAASLVPPVQALAFGLAGRAPPNPGITPPCITVLRC
ncbi:MAG: hypothetical protein ACOYL4_07260 [Miltoncostaeaceae bacterium]|jgi:hypothetical protein